MKKIGKIYLGTLNQHAMSFTRNMNNIKSSLNFCKDNKIQIRPGFELEITGQSCMDHFKELDTFRYGWNLIKEILESDYSNSTLIELGMPILHNLKVYNCLVYIYKSKILLIRPKSILSNSNKGQENRYFDHFSNLTILENFNLPQEIKNVTGQENVKFGVSEIIFKNFSYFSVFREELDSVLFNKILAKNIHFVNIVGNSAFELNNFTKFSENLKNLSSKNNTTFMTQSFNGTDGSKFVYEGGSFVYKNGKVFEYLERFSFHETLNSYVEIPNLFEKTQSKSKIKINKDFFLNQNIENPPKFKELKSLKKVEEEEIINATISYLWDIFKKSKCCGFFTPLSGGADSAITSMYVYLMCKKITQSNTEIQNQFKELTNYKEDFSNPEKLVKKIYFTAYLPMNFSKVTKGYSKNLAKLINSNFMIANIHNIVESFKTTIKDVLDLVPKFISEGGDMRQDLALQNTQARTRLVLSYLFAQLLVVKYDLKSFLLVCATGNLSEVMRGYYTKYDNSSGDLDLIGSLHKHHVWNVLKYMAKNDIKFDILNQIADQKPTAELRPLDEKKDRQVDEDDMGFTYDELDFLSVAYKEEKSGFGSLTKLFMKKFGCGKELASEKVQRFFWYLQTNRHKTITLPPSVHLTTYNTDSSNDYRPIQYEKDFLLQKRTLDEFLKK